MTITHYSPDHREWLVREILAAPQEERHTELARRVGVSRETVRRVRFGTMWATIAPELERHRIADRMASCRSCRLFDDDRIRCSLRLPEAFGPDGCARLSAAQNCNCYFER